MSKASGRQECHRAFEERAKERESERERMSVPMSLGWSRAGLGHGVQAGKCKVAYLTCTRCSAKSRVGWTRKKGSC
jgi:hypothetical protein